MRVWIEIAFVAAILAFDTVTLHVRVWIEIEIIQKFYSAGPTSPST